MIFSEFQKLHEASFLKLVRSMWLEKAVYDAVDYSLIDPYYYQDHILYNPEYIVLVLLGNGEVRGFYVARYTQTALKIVMLYIAPEHRGQGYAKGFKNLMVDIAENLGVEKITAVNRYDNDNSYHLNVSMGWNIIPITQDYYRAEWVIE